MASKDSPKIHAGKLIGPQDELLLLFSKMDIVSNSPLNSYDYTHRLVYPSDLIREFSLCSNGGYYKNTTALSTENKYLWNVKSQTGHLYHKGNIGKKVYPSYNSSLYSIIADVKTA